MAHRLTTRGKVVVAGAALAAIGGYPAVDALNSAYDSYQADASYQKEKNEFFSQPNLGEKLELPGSKELEQAKKYGGVVLYNTVDNDSPWKVARELGVDPAKRAQVRGELNAQIEGEIMQPNEVLALPKDLLDPTAYEYVPKTDEQQLVTYVVPAD